MSEDPGPSSAARQLPPWSDGEYDADEHAVHSENSGHDVRPDETSASRRQKKTREGLVKKLELVRHLQKSLDMIVVVYICTLYYMECSFFRFILRLVPHYSSLSPKDGPLLPLEQPNIYGIFVPSVLCILVHMFFGLPEAGEATRGYLHGGVIIDFIGQKPPTSRLAFLFLDLIILGAQCLMLAVHRELEGLKKAVTPGLRTTSPDLGQPDQITVAPATTVQDHDAEERGVLREESLLGYGGGIELQPLSGSSSRQRDGSAVEDERMGNTFSSAVDSADMLDVIRSGNAVLGNFHVIHAVRTVGNGAHAAAAYSLSTLGYGATLAALAAERRSRLITRQQR
ncbi:uncharacterized protein P884DRAFT_220768 [Thermothelomyces heterothallicus CBS 202.75]|uniref:uncharacterized protein n=1 Tax=Thermothelomyces heterothallicus CBS 202.75 TaxID=1149848 RepID=UPI0037445040